MSSTEGAADMVGARLGGFLLQDVLGEGGQATVFRAEGLVSRGGSLSRCIPAAVKVVRRSRGDEATVLRFLRELALASRLLHPYAVALYGYGASRSILWTAMELVSGSPLTHYVQEALRPAEVVLLLSRVCEVVEAAHRRGIIHRDLKPANIIVSEDLHPKLLDFGIAKEVTDESPAPGLAAPQDDSRSSLYTRLTGQGSSVGTPAYMAPEAWLTPTQVDARADIYALGVLAFELLEGQRPFRGDSPAAYMRAHLEAPLPELRRHPAFTAVIHRALAKDARARWPDALSFGVALGEGLS
jgi:serine/threonine-protein kinase